MTDPNAPGPATAGRDVIPGQSPGPDLPPAVHVERRKRVVGWQSRDILRAAALVAAIYVVLRLFWVAHLLFFVVFLGILFGLAVGAAVDRLERFRIPRGLGAASVVIGFLALLYGFGAWMAPTLREQSREVQMRLPQAANRAEEWLDRHDNGLVGMLIGHSDSASTPADSTRAAQGAGQGEGSALTALRERIGSRMGGATHYLFPFLHSTVEAFGALLIIIFLSVYIAAEPQLYRSGLMHLFPRRARARADAVLGAMATALRKWLVTQLIAMAVMGAVTTIALVILHVKAALALGILTGLLQFIPTVGPIVSSVPAIAMGFVDSPEKALTVLIVYILLHFLESHILVPLLMRGGVNLPPALTIVTLALMALVFGFIGLMVAVPLLAAVMVPVKMLYVEGVVGDALEPLDEGVDDDH